MTNADIKKLETNINNWEKKLLDLGKKNNLINYKETKSSTIEFETPSMSNFWKVFVEDETTAKFPFLVEDEDVLMSEDDFLFEEEELFEVGSFKLKSKRKEMLDCSELPIKTKKTSQNVNKILKNLKRRAKIANEEQGVQILFLAFGFLSWKESRNSSVCSPLLLVPVKIQWTSLSSPLELCLGEDDIILNPTLAYRLEQDFNEIIPEFNYGTDSFESFQSKIEAFAKKNKWSVKPMVALGCFSFLKNIMYKDIQIHIREIKENKIVQGFAGLTTEGIDLSEWNNCNLDQTVSPKDTFQILDADSSQQEAILCAKSGRSFVLQGPPGTGKSQTIANIISELLAQGKKVLFVSEKMAALDVVLKRLTQCQLSDFCLSLHSNKTNKKDVIAQLDAVVRLSQNKLELQNELTKNFDDLLENRKNINDYVHSLFSINKPLNRTLFSVFAELSELDDTKVGSFAFNNIGSISEEEYDHLLYLVKQIAFNLQNVSLSDGTNPWIGCLEAKYSKTFQNNFTTKLIDVSELVSKLKRIQENSDLELEKNARKIDTINKLKKICFLSSKIRGYKCSSLASLDSNIRIELLKKLNIEVDNKNKVSALRETINESFCKLKHNFSEAIPDDVLNNSFAQRRFIETLRMKDLTFTKFCEKSDTIVSFVNQAELIFKSVNESKSKVEQDFYLKIFDLDIDSMLNRFKTIYKGKFHAFNSQYRNDLKSLESCSKKSRSKLSDESWEQLLNELNVIKNQEDNASKFFHHLEILFTECFDGLNTDFVEIGQKINLYTELLSDLNIFIEIENLKEAYALRKKNFIEFPELSYLEFDSDWDSYLTMLMDISEVDSMMQQLQFDESFIKKTLSKTDNFEKFSSFIYEIDKYFSERKTNIEWFVDLFDQNTNLADMNFDQLEKKLTQCRDDFAGLNLWIDYRNTRDDCLKAGLNSFISFIEEEDIVGNDVEKVFKKAFLEQWVDSVMEQYPAIQKFTHLKHEHQIAEFIRLDKSQFKIAQTRVRQKIINSLPDFTSFSNPDINLLKHEIGKQRRIMPIRTLFRSIPNLILELKPCLMMSPLTVSQFLESSKFHFDTVIFDEASQVKTENAIGAIMRGNQLIIAGDIHQLPPTSFFESSNDESDFDTEDDENIELASGESVLDEATFLPSKELTWHYRSKHEDLITFSNVKIYDGQLNTFPSSTYAKENFGVEYIYIKDGYQNREKGTQKGNVNEAIKVAQLVFEHFRERPNRSLGVITFGENQLNLVEKELIKMRKLFPAYEQFFSESLTEDGFFVKSIENVQGDERDTIILSIGYGKNHEGRMSMNFGPLNRQGGERRLNVAITRARYNLKVVGSIVASDIDINRTSATGPKLLKSFIDYAQNGPLSIKNEINYSENPSFDSPFERSVYNFLKQNGFDVVTQVGCSKFRIDLAIKNPKSGSFVLGIECDGASYHSGKTARDRDRIRQEILEFMGWKIYRIWSTDWNFNTIEEKHRLLKAVQSAINKQQLELSAKTMISEENTNQIDMAIDPKGTFVPYICTKPESKLVDFSTKKILEIITVEHPIKKSLIIDRASCSFLYDRNLSKSVNNALEELLSEKKIEEKEKEVYTLPGAVCQNARFGARGFCEIPEEELKVGIQIVANQTKITNPKDLSLETLKYFHFMHPDKDVVYEMERLIKERHEFSTEEMI